MVLTIKLRNIVMLFIILSLVLVTVAFVAADEECVEVPVIMYHGILKDKNYHGRFVISPEQFEQDLQWLKKEGYTAVFMADLINYVEKGTPLPKKPIVLTFDDGYYNNYIYAYPLAKKYNTKIVISAVGKFSEQLSDEKSAYYSHLSWQDMKEMTDSGVVEMQNHSYDMHSVTDKRNGSKKNNNESEQQYKEIFSADTIKTQQLIKDATGKLPTTYTYPFGSVSKSSYSILKELGFKASLSCSRGINKITREKDCLFMLKRFIRPHNNPVWEILD